MTSKLPKPATIGEPRPTKLARHLDVGDWISGSNAGEIAPLMVIATHPYFEADLANDAIAIAIVFTRSDGGKPRVVYAEPNDPIWLATEGELHPPSPWVAIADELHRIADDLAKLTNAAEPYFRLNIQPGPRGKGDAAVRDAVDTVSMALFGHQGSDRELSGGTYHYSTHGNRGPIGIDIYQSVTEPLEDPMASGREIDNGDQPADVPTCVDGTSITGRPVSGPPASATGAGR